MSHFRLYGLIISGLISMMSFADVCARQKNDDIWKQLPASQPAYHSDRVSAPIDPRKQDSSRVTVLKFDSAALHNYLEDDEFLYDRPRITSESFTARLMRWLRQKLNDFFDTDGDTDWTDNIFYALAVIIITFVIARLIGLQPQLFIRKKGKVPDEFIIGNENIHTIAFGPAITAAEAQGDFRYAIRLHYLQLLKELTDHGMIRWEPQKTNMQYVSEMAKTSFAADFESLTRYFAYAWYGHFEVSAEAYQLFRQSKQVLLAQIENTQTAKA